MATEIPATDYLTARNFLNQLVGEAWARVENGEGVRFGGNSRAAVDSSTSKRSVGTVSAASFDVPLPAAAPAPEAAADIIPWPRPCHPRFAAQRAIVEAPYRRNPKGQANPTAAEYRSMAEAAGLMTLVLRPMVVEIPAADYLVARTFLNQLADEAWRHVEKDEAARSSDRLLPAGDSPASSTGGQWNTADRFTYPPTSQRR